MKNVIFVDARMDFLQNLQTKALLDENLELTILCTVNDISNLRQMIERYRPDEIIIADNMIDAQPDWNIGVNISGYAASAPGIQLIQSMGIACYGMFTARDAGGLLKAVESGKVIEPAADIQTPPMQPLTGIDRAPSMDIPTQQNTYNSVNGQMPYGQPEQSTMPYGMQNPVNPPMPNQMPPVQPTYPYNNGQAQMPYGQPEQSAMPYGMQNPVNPPMPNQMPPVQPTYPYNNGQAQMPYGQPEQSAMPYGMQNPTQPLPYNMTEPTIPNAVDRMAEARQQQNIAQFEAQFNKEQERKTKVISLFSAKGGVGKSTLSSSLALSLSMMSNGKERIKVALLDFDVDFGDILMLLALDTSEANMVDWGEAIRGRVINTLSQQNPQTAEEKERMVRDITENMHFTNEEILDYMQEYSKTGLQVLVAPLAHKKSMEFNGYEFAVMLRNLRDSGLFDYIICDTGNNTRDASFSAIEMADVIYLVNTQEITTVNCNDTFLAALMDIGFDMSKFKIIMNKVRPQSETGVSVEEVEKLLKDYECVCRVRYNSGIVKASNKAEPLIFQAKNEFTQDLQYLTMDVLGDKIEHVENAGKKKHGLFHRK